jgi:fumarate hydratase, class II
MICYDKASAIAHKANDEGLTLKEAALPDEERFDEVVDPRTMVSTGSAEVRSRRKLKARHRSGSSL